MARQYGQHGATDSGSDGTGIESEFAQGSETRVTDPESDPPSKRPHPRRRCKHKRQRQSRKVRANTYATDYTTDSDTGRTGSDSDAPRAGKRKRKHKHQPPSHKDNAYLTEKNTSSDDGDSNDHGENVSDSDDSRADPDDDTDDEISSGDEDDDYSVGYRRLIDRLEDQWKRFCRKRQAALPEEFKWQDPVAALHEVTRRTLYRFFNWRFKLKWGKGGRRMRGTKKSSSLKSDWKNFLRYYERATEKKLDPRLMRLTRKSLRRLAKKWQLDNQEKEKTPVYIEDMAPFQETLLRTQEKRFWLGLQRMQLCLYNLIGLFTLNRKTAILNLRYRDLLVSLQRDPCGGPHIPTVEFGFAFTKKHLGLTQTNTFPLPEIIYDPSLILSPHTFLFGILFFFKAFEAPHLTSMTKLRNLKIGGNRQQQPVPLKPEMADHYIFCKVAMDHGKICIFPREKMNPDAALRVVAEITGFLHPWFTHRGRYGGGKILNRNGLVGDAEQNLVLKHASIRTFLEHYLPRHIDLDMQSLIRGHEPNAPLMRAMTRMGRWLDKRRPRHLTDEQKAAVEQDLELQEAIRQRNKAEWDARVIQSDKAIAKLNQRKRDVRNTRNRLVYKRRREVREEFDNKQAVIDIERQLTGQAVDEKAMETLHEEQVCPQQIHLLQNLLTWPTSRSVDDEFHRRDAGVEAVKAYCGVHEGGPRRGRRPKKPLLAPNIQDKPKPDHIKRRDSSQSDLIQKMREHVLQAPRPRACFECGKWYSRPQDVGRHFRNNHLRYLLDHEPTRCSFCEVDLDNKMHLQAHAKMVHRTHT